MNQIITLSDINKSNLLRYLESLNSTTECEIRFGNFVYVDNKNEFVANVEIDFFYRLKNMLDNEKDIEKTIIVTKELSYGDLREIIHTDTNIKEYMIKNTFKKHNIFDYDCRVSLSSEKKVKEPLVKYDIPSFIRYKNRSSYKFNCGSLDLTIVTQGKTDEEAKNADRIHYEVEFEISKNDYTSILQVLTFILQIRQNNYFVINSYEKRNIINQYRELVMPQKKSHPYFIGAQPETLQKDQLSCLFKELYSVTDKADGDRYFMFINNNGVVSFLDSNINVLKTDLKSNIKNTIIDGELIKNENETLFFAFDILYFNNIDLRGNNEYLLKQRLEKLDIVIKSINTSSFFNIQLKTFYYRNVFIGAEYILKNINNKPYKNDGLIFTPMNEPYPKIKKWQTLLKWKPAELNTIDFFSIKNGNVWKLYVQDISSDKQQQNDKQQAPQLVLFDVDKLCGNLIKKYETNIFETSFDESLKDPTTHEPYKTNTVIEFHWDTTTNKFLPLRTRWDKTINPSKHGNFSTVACSIWNNINNPITSSQLFQMTNTTTEQKKDFFFEHMNSLHNKIHESLIKKYITDTNEYIIELNTFNKIKYDNTYTFCNSIKKSNIHYKNIKIDLTSENTPSIIKTTIGQKVSTIFCLKFNTFLQSQEILNNFIHIIDYNIKQNGYLILSFIDYDKVKQMTQHSFIQHNEIMYIVDINDSTSHFNHIKLFINGVSNENELIEYIVPFNFLIEFMKTKGYSCIESGNYTGNLKSYEEQISNLYKFCVFQKTESHILSTLKQKSVIQHNTYTYNPVSIIVKNLIFHKISTLYDIFDILNCIQFTIFKNNYENKDILLFEDIDLSMTNFIPFSNSQEPILNNSIYFYNYIYEEDEQVFSHFYIILYKNTIIQSVDSIKIITNILNQKESLDIKKESLDIKKELKDKIKNELLNSKNATIVKLKEYLKLLNCKINGNKDELLTRLYTILNN